jgi:hypothetical protein
MAIARLGMYPRLFRIDSPGLQASGPRFTGCGTITLDMAYSICKKVIIGLGQFRGASEKELWKSRQAPNW